LPFIISIMWPLLVINGLDWISALKPFTWSDGKEVIPDRERSEECEIDIVATALLVLPSLVVWRDRWNVDGSNILRAKSCSTTAPSRDTGVDDLADWDVIIAIWTIDIELDLDITSTAIELTASVWALDDEVLDASWNLLACRDQCSALTLALWTTLRVEVLDLDTASWAVVKWTEAFDTLVLDASNPVLTAFGELAASKVVDTATELATTEAIALAAGSIDIVLWLQAASAVLWTTAWSLTSTLWTASTWLTLWLAQWASWTLESIGTADIAMVPVALAADLTWILEAYITLAVFAALTARDALEAWLLLSLTAKVVASTAVILGEVAVDPLTEVDVPTTIAEISWIR
jgi:hypothetical protein